VARFAAFGLLLQAPWNHYYYILLDGALPPTPEPFTATTGVKVVIDQFIQAPIYTVLIFYFLGILEGKSVDSVKQQLDRDYKVNACTFLNMLCSNCSSVYHIIHDPSPFVLYCIPYRIRWLPTGNYGYQLHS